MRTIGRAALCVSFLFVCAMTFRPAANVKNFTVTAHQFAFTVQPGGEIEVEQGDEVVLTISSSDVVHGFSMPPFTSKALDLIPGRPVEVRFVADQTGSFVYRCTTFCGEGHPTMSGTMVVRPPTPLVVSALTPASGPALGSTSFSIAGSGIQDGATVTFGGATATNVVTTAQSIVGSTPPHAPGVVDVVVTNPNGQTAALSAAYTYIGIRAIGIFPTAGTTSGGTQFVLPGEGFAQNATVTFGGVPATGVVVSVDGTEASGVTPAHAAGAVDVEVRNPDGQSATLTAAYRFTAPASRRRAVRR